MAMRLLPRRKSHRHSELMPDLAAVVLLLTLLGASAANAEQNHWVSLGPGGKLVYAQTTAGDRIADFSYAGYQGGGVALPHVPAKRTVSPSGGDDTAAIQHAIDEVSALAVLDGLRGAVELAPGIFHCANTLNINASGVVLRGAGMGKDGTTIVMAGTPHLAVRVAGKLVQKAVGPATYLTNSYVPFGTRVIRVADASDFHVGDTLLIIKPVTDAWLHFMSMNHLSRDGQPEHWVGKDHLEVRRCIAAISGDAVTLDLPLMDNYDPQFFGSTPAGVKKVDVSGQITHVGVEDLRIVAPKRGIALGDPEFDGLTMQDAVDSWVQSVAMEETTNSIHVDSGTERITVLRCDVVQHEPVTSSAKPFDFSSNGSQILFDRCTGSGDNVFYFATQARQQGPVVMLHCRFKGDGHIQPHQRWSTGLLIDNCDVPDGGIDMMNRGEMGTGHGWAIGWGVAWNNSAKTLEMNQPPGVVNWSIGNRGAQSDPPMPVYGGPKPDLPAAVTESSGKPVKPESLYLEQLKERLGPAALKNIGYED